MNTLKPHIYFAKNSKGRYLSILVAVPDGQKIKKDRITSSGKVLSIPFSVNGSATSATSATEVKVEQFTINQKKLSKNGNPEKVRVTVGNEKIEINWNDYDNQPEMKNNQQAGYPHLFVENGKPNKLTLSVLLKNARSSKSPDLDIEYDNKTLKPKGETSDEKYSHYSEQTASPEKGETIVVCIDFDEQIQAKKKPKRGKGKASYTRSH